MTTTPHVNSLKTIISIPKPNTFTFTITLLVTLWTWMNWKCCAFIRQTTLLTFSLKHWVLTTLPILEPIWISVMHAWHEKECPNTPYFLHSTFYYHTNCSDISTYCSHIYTLSSCIRTCIPEGAFFLLHIHPLWWEGVLMYVCYTTMWCHAFCMM